MTVDSPHRKIPESFASPRLQIRKRKLSRVELVLLSPAYTAVRNTTTGVFRRVPQCTYTRETAPPKQQRYTPISTRYSLDGSTLQNLSNFPALYRKGFHIKCCACCVWLWRAGDLSIGVIVKCKYLWYTEWERVLDSPSRRLVVMGTFICYGEALVLVFSNFGVGLLWVLGLSLVLILPLSTLCGEFEWIRVTVLIYKFSGVLTCPP